MRRKLLFFSLVLFTLAVILVAKPPVLGKDVMDTHIVIYIDKPYGSIEVNNENGLAKTNYTKINDLLNKYSVYKLERSSSFAGERDYLVDEDIYIANFYNVFIPKGYDLFAAVDEFGKHQDIRIAEFDPIYTPFYSPSDELLGEQWGIFKTESDKAWDFWNIRQGNIPGNSSSSTPVLIGIVDTGVYWNHPDLRRNYFVNPAEDANGNGIGELLPYPAGDLDGIDSDDDSNTMVDDVLGWDFEGSVGYDVNEVAPTHGTHCAGIAAATTDDTIGIASTSFDVYLTATKHNDDNNNGLYGTQLGIEYVGYLGHENGFHTIISCSYGSTYYSNQAQYIINNLYNNYNCLIVAAAGNDGIEHEQNGHKEYPADYNNVIGVSGTNINNGEEYDYGNIIEVSAPGYGIKSTWDSDSYQTMGGTSMACPFTASVCALIWSAHPDWTNEQVKDRLILTAVDISEFNPDLDPEDVPPLVNIFRALALWRYPNLLVSNVAVNDNSANSDADGILNPGESGQIILTLENVQGWVDADGVTCTLYSDDDRITVTSADATMGDIGSGLTGNNESTPFEITVNVDEVFSTTLVLEIDANEGYENPYNYRLDVPIQISLNHAGWDVSLEESDLSNTPSLVDLNNDGTLECVLVSPTGEVYITDNMGSQIGMYNTDDEILGAPAIGNIDADDDLEIVVGTRGESIYILDHDGTLINEIDAGGYIVSEITLTDMDNDDQLEIVFKSFATDVQAKEADGSDVEGFPVSTALVGSSGLATGYLNGGCAPDIVSGDYMSNVRGIDNSGTELWSVNTGGPGASILVSPTLANLDDDLQHEVIFGNQTGNLYILDNDGSVILDQFDLGSAMQSSAVIGDINNDDIDDIIVVSANGILYAMDKTGTSVNENFPYDLGEAVSSSPLIGDIDGQDGEEIVVITNFGTVYIIDGNGANLEYSPFEIDGVFASGLDWGDIDNDGNSDFIAPSANTVYAIDYKTVTGTDISWPHFKKWLTRTGNAHYDGYNGIDSEYKLPPKAKNLVLKQNQPNPFNPVTSIGFYLPETSEVKINIYNILGQKVKTLRNETMDAGSYSVIWTGTDNSGNEVASGVYYYVLETNEERITKKMLLMK